MRNMDKQDGQDDQGCQNGQYECDENLTRLRDAPPSFRRAGRISWRACDGHVSLMISGHLSFCAESKRERLCRILVRIECQTPGHDPMPQ